MKNLCHLRKPLNSVNVRFVRFTAIIRGQPERHLRYKPHPRRWQPPPTGVGLQTRSRRRAYRNVSKLS